MTWWWAVGDVALDPEQVVHECSEAQVLAVQILGFGSSDQTTQRFLPLVLAVCRKCHPL